MNRYLGLNPHRYGDLFINLTAFRALKRLDPGCHVTMAINGDYREAAPLFLDQDCIDRIHITHSPIGGFDAVDMEWIKSQQFTHVFDPMQDHSHAHPWFLTGRNQPQEVAFMHGIPIAADETGKLTLNRWFQPSAGFEQYVAFHGFAGSHGPNRKMFTPERAQEIVNLIESKGYRVLQLGIPSEPKLDNTLRLDTDYFTSVKNVLGCKGLLTGDSGVCWMASCYDFPTVGVYSHDYYGEANVRAIQPINRNARYLSAPNVNDVPLADISAALDNLLS